jgi:hypothetical protein
MPKRITARDEQTGRTVTFDWHLDTPPTDEDMAEVFAQAAPTTAAPPAKREFAPPEPEGKVYANSPRDLLERGSKAVFGSASPAVNKALGIAMQAAPGAGLIHGLLSDGANTGGAIGGTVGGLAGSVPGAMAGAGAGGAVGGGLERWFRGQPQDASDITTDAILQGAGEGLAPGVARAAKAIAYPVYKAALRPGSVIAERFGDVTRRALDEGLVVTGKKAIPKTKALTTASRDKALGIVGDIDPDNLIRPSEIEPAFDRALGEAQIREQQLGMQGEVESVLKRKHRVMEGLGRGEAPLDAQAGKEASQRAANDLFDARAAGNRVSEVEDMLELDLEKVRREALERRAPDLQAQNLNTKELLGVMRAHEQAEKRHVGGVGSGNIVPDIIAGLGGMLAAGPVGAGAGIGAGRVLRSIGAAAPMSGLAIGLDRTGNVGIQHADKLTKAVRALALKLKADRQAEDERVQREYEQKQKKPAKEHP